MVVKLDEFAKRMFLAPLNHHSLSKFDKGACPIVSQVSRQSQRGISARTGGLQPRCKKMSVKIIAPGTVVGKCFATGRSQTKLVASSFGVVPKSEIPLW